MTRNFLIWTGWIILAAMLAVTTWASLYENVFSGGAKILAEPWGVATLFDTYFAFFFFTLWVWFKERSIVAKTGWFIFILTFGNIAMAIYFLNEIRRATKDGFSTEKLLTMRK